MSKTLYYYWECTNSKKEFKKGKNATVISIKESEIDINKRLENLLKKKLPSYKCSILNKKTAAIPHCYKSWYPNKYSKLQK